MLTRQDGHHGRINLGSSQKRVLPPLLTPSYSAKHVLARRGTDGKENEKRIDCFK